ncbi:MAG TPA: GyrI-like domain-containing protein [Tepiditoga sp.]|nr:hypothetical protein [Thermotogota bacterium]HOO75994.1 GyrI-like domain-containing protein [Tepiditoga sp.]
MDEMYSEITIVDVPKMKVARYVMITPSPEDDVIAYMNNWAEKSGLLDYEGYVPKKIGWDFPYVSKEQTEKFGLRGYVCAYILPEDFTPKCEGAEITYIEKDTYAKITIKDPHTNSFVNIPLGYKKIFDYINNNEYKTKTWENRLAFEEEYIKDGIIHLDIYIPVK